MPRGNYGGIRLRNNEMPLIRAASFFLEIGLLFVNGVSNTKYGWSNERRIMLAIGVLQVLGSIILLNMLFDSRLGDFFLPHDWRRQRQADDVRQPPVEGARPTSSS